MNFLTVVVIGGVLGVLDGVGIFFEPREPYKWQILFAGSEARSRTAMTRKKPTTPKAPEVCPVCREDVPRDALACPECGADHNSGWRGDADTYDAVDLPDQDFNYDEFVKHEFGSSP